MNHDVRARAQNTARTENTKLQNLRLFVIFHNLFLAAGFLSSLGDLAGSLLGLHDRLDDTNGDGLEQVSNGENDRWAKKKPTCRISRTAKRPRGG